MWFARARSNRYSPGPARLAPGVRACAGWLDIAPLLVVHPMFESPIVVGRGPSRQGPRGRSAPLLTFAYQDIGHSHRSRGNRTSCTVVPCRKPPAVVSSARTVG